jgi:hypothetical protein
MNPEVPSIHIEQVHLDLRGLPAAKAEAAVRSLGPALSAAWANPSDTRRQITREMSAADLTSLLAQQLAAAIHREAASPEEIS